MAAKTARAQPGAVTLKPVGLSEDGSQIILAKRANAKSGGFRVAVDKTLLDHVRKASEKARRDAEPAAPPSQRQPLKVVESKLSPKEIQAFLREGKSVSFIAKKAGVPVEWVERFEVPIVWERAGMASRAQRATMFRQRSGRSAAPLGDAVRANLLQRRSTLEAAQIDAGWDSIRHSKTGKWIVKFSFPSRGQNRVAQWEYDPESDQVFAVNKLATDLGWIQNNRRRAAR